MEVTYFKIVIDGFIWAVGIGTLDKKFQITKDEYEHIIMLLKNKPKDTEKIRYLLDDKTLKWTETEAPKPEPEEEKAGD